MTLHCENTTDSQNDNRQSKRQLCIFCNFEAQGYSPSQEKGFCDGPFLPKCSPQTKCPLSACSRGKERKRL